MVWTSPMTAVAGNTFAASQYNLYVRDNLLESGVAKLTAANGTFVTDSANSVAARYPVGSAIVTTDQSTTSASYIDLATPGPSVTLTTGTDAIIIWAARLYNSLAEYAVYCSYEVSGASTFSPDSSVSLIRDGMGTSGRQRAGMMQARTNLTPGINTFTMKYKVFSSGTGSFAFRQIIVIPI